ncbi:MAG: hypothetical protein WAK19_10830, partial [Candidatus Cybelea sp.]
RLRAEKHRRNSDAARDDCNVARTSAQAPSFPPPEAGGSDVVYARICREGPVFWADELRW